VEYAVTSFLFVFGFVSHCWEPILPDSNLVAMFWVLGLYEPKCSETVLSETALFVLCIAKTVLYILAFATLQNLGV
jgi:hypothetical protein